MNIYASLLLFVAVSCSSPSESSTAAHELSKSERSIRRGCDVYIPRGHEIANKKNFSEMESFYKFLESDRRIEGIKPCFYVNKHDPKCLFVMDDGPSLGTAFKVCKRRDKFTIEYEE